MSEAGGFRTATRYLSWALSVLRSASSTSKTGHHEADYQLYAEGGSGSETASHQLAVTVANPPSY